jgi:hypothetical protein
MGSRVRPATEEDRRKLITFAERFPEGSIKNLVTMAEEEYGLRAIYYKHNWNGELPILMPSGQVFVRDTKETGTQLDKSLIDSGYKGDMTPNGEVTNAVAYSTIIFDEYINFRIKNF